MNKHEKTDKIEPMKKTMEQIVGAPVILNRNFTLTLHDGPDGTSTGGTKIQLHGVYNFSDTTLERVLDLAEKTVRIARQAPNRKLMPSDGDTLDINVSNGRVKKTALDKGREATAKIDNVDDLDRLIMLCDERKKSIQKQRNARKSQ